MKWTQNDTQSSNHVDNEPILSNLKYQGYSWKPAITAAVGLKVCILKDKWHAVFKLAYIRRYSESRVLMTKGTNLAALKKISELTQQSLLDKE